MSRAVALALVATLVVSALLLTGFSATATAGASGASVSPASTPPAVSWTANELCSDIHQAGIVYTLTGPPPSCPSGVGYVPEPIQMLNASGGFDGGVPVWMASANSSSGEFAVVANTVFTSNAQQTCTPSCYTYYAYDYPSMWAWLPADGWVNMTQASALGTAPGTLGGDLRQGGGCMAWDPQENYFLALAAQDNRSGNLWTFAYTPGQNPLPGGIWTNRSNEITGWSPYGCSMAWDPQQSSMVVTDPALGGGSSNFAYWSGNGGWSAFSSSSYPNQPPCAENASMAYDPLQQEVIWFGGSTSGCTNRPSPMLSYTWAWTGSTTWNNLTGSLADAPPAREWASASTTSFGSVLLGGTDSAKIPQSGVLNDSWVFDGRWLQISLATTSGSQTFCPVYAASSGPINSTGFLLFGGATTGTGGCTSPISPPGGAAPLNETWEVYGTAQPASGLSANDSGLPCTESQLAWSNPVAPYGMSLVNDTVYIYGSTGTLVQTVSTNGPTTSVVATGLTCGASYTFRVRSWFSDGVSSPLSAALSFIAGSAAGSGQGGGGGSSGSGLDLTLIAIVVVVAVVAIAVVGMSARRRRPGGRER